MSSSSWGGLPVVLFLGDDIQLPQGCDSLVYICKSTKPSSLHGALVWKELVTAVTLPTIVSQKESQTQLKDVLMSRRNNSLSNDQAKRLQNYQWDSLKKKSWTALAGQDDTRWFVCFSNT